MKIASASSTDPDPIRAAATAYDMLREKLGEPPQLMLVHSSCAYDNEALVAQLRTLAPGVPLQGGTSCLGVVTESGFQTQEGLGLGILGVLDPEGGYGVGIGESDDDDPETAARAALVQALTEADRPGELPGVVVTTSYPGHEEFVIRAIEDYLGANVPIIGGTSADNDMSGQWQQFGNDTVGRRGISVAALFPSGEIGYAFHSGYEPTRHRGRATRAAGRILYEIDGRPAARVYDEWTEGLIADVLPEGGNLVPTTAFTPIGNPVGQVGGIPYFRLSYPVEVLAGEALQLYTDVREDCEVVLMTGNHDSLATRAGRVAAAAVDAAPFRAEEIRGALVLFCAGCMLAIRDRMDEVVKDLRPALGHAPLLTAFTLGEQGCFIGGENRHGNLMIAVLVFGPLSVE